MYNSLGRLLNSLNSDMFVNLNMSSISKLLQKIFFFLRPLVSFQITSTMVKKKSRSKLLDHNQY